MINFRNLPSDHPLHNLDFKNCLDRFKVESADKIIKAVIALRSKMYAIKFFKNKNLKKEPEINNAPTRKRRLPFASTISYTKEPRLEECKIKVDILKIFLYNYKFLLIHTFLGGTKAVYEGKSAL